jgi:hypothetical protein
VEAGHDFFSCRCTDPVSTFDVVGGVERYKVDGSAMAVQL